MRIVQSSTIHSPRRHTLRGVHYQEAPHAEIKLVRCTRGSIYLVMVDLRPCLAIPQTSGSASSSALEIRRGCRSGPVVVAGAASRAVGICSTATAWPPPGTDRAPAARHRPRAWPRACPRQPACADERLHCGVASPRLGQRSGPRQFRARTRPARSPCGHPTDGGPLTFAHPGTAMARVVGARTRKSEGRRAVCWT
jgi:dTDP-4-dehydrorhamnose 3,5-epimerase